MAIMVVIRVEGLTPEQHDRLRAAVGWLEDVPMAGVFILHVQDLGLPDKVRSWILPRHELSVPEPAQMLAT